MFRKTWHIAEFFQRQARRVMAYDSIVAFLAAVFPLALIK